MSGNFFHFRMQQQRRHCCALLALGGIMLLAGCVGPQRNWIRSQQPDELPVAHSAKGPGFVIHSDDPVDKDGSLVVELTQLQHRVRTTLQLPPQRDRVSVYLFSDRDSYRKYMEKTWPDLPDRRAYFIGTTRELAVYSYQGPRVEEDLRHEMTHGMLHASLKTVPLWLDEGLAEYFEVSGPHGVAHPEHAATIRNLLESGWSPSLERLEAIRDFDRLTQQDYAESWAWVFYLLHADAGSRDTLLSYLATLRNEDAPQRLWDSLPRDAALRMADHVRRLPSIPSAGVVQIQGG